MFISFSPAMMVWGMLMRRRTQSLPYEFLLPVNRAGYLKQVGMAAAFNQFQVWIGVSLAAVLWWQIAAPDQSPSNLANALAFSALWQVGFFGLIVWFVRLRSRILPGVVLFVAMQITMMGTLLFQQGPLSTWQPFLLPAAGVFAAIGLLLVWDAYRRWMVADLD